VTECVFCRIARGETSAHKIYEDEKTLAFLDIHPLVDGHTMVIPKAHYECLEDMPLSEVGRLFEAVAKVSGAIRRAFGTSATTIGINNGRAAGQVVPHIHVHIIPRYPADGGGTIHSIIHTPSKRRLDEVQTLIIAAIEG
jgi:histidine triad (HIT) family protein